MLARAPSDELSRHGAPVLRSTLDHIVVALVGDVDERALEHLPPSLRQVNWPRSDAIDALAGLARSKLAAIRETLGARCDAAGVPATQRSAMVDEAALPAAT